ncbi:MAG: ABC transporter ATP-binding protein [Thermomicrobiales bacterium]|nr:ABC transporter ATP-binding protein [Thermomicrobiales bacterium]
MTPPLLELSDIVVRASGRAILEVPAFVVDAGEAVALFGPNGAGKTTLLHIAALLRQPDSGVVSIGGVPATARNAACLRRALSVVFQDPLLFDRSVLANAAAGLRFQGVPRADAEQIARGWLARFGVAHLASRGARDLSGGEASRVALARAFATEPAILLLDEPFSALDAPARAALLAPLRDRVRQSGASALLVTHDLAEAFTFADRVCLLDGGRIIASGPGPALIAHPPSLRAASLLGIENLLTGAVAEISGDEARVALEPGGTDVRACLPAQQAISPHQRVTIALPAGAVRVVAAERDIPAGWNALPGIVAAVTPLPSGSRLVVQTPAPFVASLPWAPGRPWSVGGRVAVAFAPASAHLIPETA